jgi:hypothetical protein
VDVLEKGGYRTAVLYGMSGLRDPRESNSLAVANCLFQILQNRPESAGRLNKKAGMFRAACDAQVRFSLPFLTIVT